MTGHMLFFEKYFTYIDKYSNVNEIEPLSLLESKKIKTLELKNCTFKYGDKLILDNINLKIRENEIIALVGLNGSGKTTLVRILMGLLKPTSGKVLVNGIELDNYGLQNYWAKSAYVPQLFAQFNFTVEEAILLGRSVNNSKIFGDDFFMEGIPSLTQQLGKEFSGSDLSTGQWQKLAIMRSLIDEEKKELFFFDEPTSAIDPLSEEKIYSIIEKTAKNKIAIYVTHRMSTVTHATRVILLDKQKIVGDSNHRSLYQTNLLYRQMFDSQAGRFLEHTKNT
ncbi:ATP-binding cassette domain-containing protein [Bartonella sp. DGB1]|uniref:ATP-binding cassette domain-containing protein n=1 Tax=Bartonella sp. DGB1 TaxID=3239807 RepID=UPI0035232085